MKRGGCRGRVLLAALTLALALLAVEILLRIVGVEAPFPVHEPGEIVPAENPHADPRLGWKMLPHEVVREQTGEFDVVYEANAQGFRTPWDLDADFDGESIVFLGDSYTQGTGVHYEETFVARIDAHLPDIRVVNLGIGAFGIDQMWMTLRHFGARVEPRTVVLAFIRNDLDRSLSAYRNNGVWFEKPTFRLRDGELVPAAEVAPGWRRWIARRTGIGRLWSRFEYSLSRRFAIGERWRLNRALFEAIRRETEALGAELLVVHIPINRLHGAEALGRAFEAMDIEFLDLADHLPADPAPLYFPVNRHFTARGHAFAAEVLLAHLDSSR